MKAIIIEKIISYKRNHYRVNYQGKWEVLIFDWGKPAYKWCSIQIEKVPKEVMEEA